MTESLSHLKTDRLNGSDRVRVLGVVAVDSLLSSDLLTVASSSAVSLS